MHGQPAFRRPDRSSRQRGRSARSDRRSQATAAILCEVEVATGLETVVRAELVDRLGGRAAFGPLGASESRRGAVRFGYRGSLRSLCELRTAHAVYVVVPFAVPRPRALLGDQNLRLLLTHIDAVLSLWPVGTFQTLTLSAAGAESPVLSRLRDEIARRTGLSPDNGSGHLLLRMRRADTEAAGWEVLIRISPRPLAVRSWRVCDYKGALNAAVAHAMVLLTRPRPGDVFLNIACGSATLLIERAAAAPVRQMIGCDIRVDALACARANVAAAGQRDAVRLCQSDARSLPLPAGSIDAICADLPFGHLIGSHQENVALYPQILREAARVARADARFVLITSEARLIETAVSDCDEWLAEDRLPVRVRGQHVRVLVLRRIRR